MGRVNEKLNEMKLARENYLKCYITYLNKLKEEYSVYHFYVIGKMHDKGYGVNKSKLLSKYFFERGENLLCTDFCWFQYYYQVKCRNKLETYKLDNTIPDSICLPLKFKIEACLVINSCKILILLKKENYVLSIWRLGKNKEIVNSFLGNKKYSHFHYCEKKKLIFGFNEPFIDLINEKNLKLISILNTQEEKLLNTNFINDWIIITNSEKILHFINFLNNSIVKSSFISDYNIVISNPDKFYLIEKKEKIFEVKKYFVYQKKFEFLKLISFELKKIFHFVAINTRILILKESNNLVILSEDLEILKQIKLDIIEQQCKFFLVTNNIFCFSSKGNELYFWNMENNKSNIHSGHTENYLSYYSDFINNFVTVGLYFVRKWKINDKLIS